MVDDRMRLRVAVLGPLLVERDGEDVAPRSGVQRRLLALLVLHSPQPVSVDALIDVGWPDGDVPKEPRENVQTHMSRLRSQLGTEGVVVGEAGVYRLSSLVTSDLEELSTLTAAAEPDGIDPLSPIERALALWRGPSLVDIADTDAGMGDAMRLDELRLSLREARFGHLSQLDPDPRVVVELEAFTLQHPYRERPYALLMETLYHLGRQADALATYKRLRSRLANDLGLEPSPELRELESQILGQQLAPRRDAAVSSGSAPVVTADRPIGAPAAATSLVGRERDLDRLRTGLERSRLVTISGPGGVGKTRLAMEIGRQLAERHETGPVVWCDLMPAAVESEVLDVVALALGAHRRGRQSSRDAILETTAGVEPTVLLDNCEHVTGIAADLGADILAASPAARVVATSRTPLDVVGEELIALEPMPWSATGDLSDRPPAVELFWQRSASAGARLVDDEETRASVARVCGAVDGLPLGIELAAAQLRNMTLGELADRVTAPTGALDMSRRSGTERHRSIRSALSWSLNALPDVDRRFFDMLSVFPGSFDATAAAAVTDSADVDAVASQLRELSDLCLVTVDVAGGRSRFRLLRTSRLIGHERVVIDGMEPILLDRHRDWFVRFVRKTGPLLRGPREADAAAALEAEIDNLRGVVRRAVADGDSETALVVATAFSDYVLHRLRDDLIDWSEMAMVVAGADRHRLHALAMATVAMGVINRGDLERAERLSRAVIDGETTDTAAMMLAHHALSLCALYSGRLDQARTIAEDHLLLAESADEPYDGQFAAMIIALAAHYAGEQHDALDYAGRSRAFAERSGAPSSLAWSDYVFGEVLADVVPEQSQAHFESAIEAGIPVCNELVVGVARVSLTTLPLEAGHEPAVLRAYARLIEGWSACNDWTHQWTTLQNLVPLLVRCGAHVDAAVIAKALISDGGGTRLFGDAADQIDSIRTDLRRQLGSDELSRVELLATSLTARQVAGRALEAIARLLEDLESGPLTRN